MRRGLQALAVGLVIVSLAGSASNKYIVRPGDSISKIAAKFKVSSESLIRANRLSSPHKLRVGMTLTIPTGRAVSKAAAPASAPKARPASKVVGTPAAPKSSPYVIKRGDNDWVLAKRLGVSVEAIHELNPGVNWNRLRIGQTLRVPATKSTTLVSSTTRATPAPPSGGKYTVARGDNDWVIAARLGTTASKLRAANPGVVWTRLQIGQKLNVPAGARVASATARPLPRSVVVSAASVYVRQGPSTRHGVITTAKRGSYAYVLGKQSSWYKVRLASSGKVGWIRDDMLKAATTTREARSVSASSGSKIAYNAKTGNEAVDIALSMLGTRYRYGMSSRSGTDCSGLTTLVYRALGIKLPRTSSEQSRIGVAVSKSELKPGDLVFFRTGRSRRINHVGLYMGNGKFVHSSSSKRRVRIDSLDDGYYQSRFVTARRVRGAMVAKAETATAPKGRSSDSEAQQTESDDSKGSAVKPDGAGPKAHVPGRDID